MLRNAAAIALAVTIASSHVAHAAGKRAARSVAAGNTQILLFNLTPAASYAVRRNNVAGGTVVAAPSGVVRYETNASNGDVFQFMASDTLIGRGVDTAGPSISQRSPAPGATNVALNSSVFFVTADDKTGVNASSISVKLDNVACPLSTSAVTGGFAVQCDPAHYFPAHSDVSVAISVADLATPPNVTERTYSFHTGSSAVVDNAPPATHATSPGNGATVRDPRPTIEVQLDDAGVGVDIASIVLEINGNAVAFAVEGDPSSVRIRYRPGSAFAPLSSVHVHVEACDRAQPPHCSTIDYQFSVSAGNAAVAGNGAIVPDGYWANDAARPLEVRDLPAHWGVHIFDTAGASVRHHVNQNDGDTWTWDFRNDIGSRVAPALYLVRVTDGSGAVKRSGRFLVQSPR
jgi:hypothetical protein